MPRRQWNKYLNQNSYREADCQLVTALNAYYCLTGKVWCKQESVEYHRLRKLCGAVAGSAININKVYRVLGIKVVKTFKSEFSLTYYKRPLNKQERRHCEKLGIKSPCTYSRNKTIPLPLEVCVWEKHYGFHSSLIVDYEPRTRCYRVTNLKYATSLEGWMFTEDMYQFLQRGLDIPAFRLFGLRGEKC